MVDNPFFAFVDFVESDRSTDILVQKKELLMREIEHLQGHIKEEEAKVGFLRKTVHELKKEVDVQDLEVRALRTQEQEKKVKLALVTVPREYLSLQHELELLAQKIDDYEDRLISRWQELEDRQQVLQQETERLNQEQQRVARVMTEKQQVLAVMNSDIEHFIQERKSKEHFVVPEWRETYYAMKERVPNPAVPVAENACSACFYHIPPNDLALLRRHKILQCKDCYRLLYLV